jgi:hypothetical protein
LGGTNEIIVRQIPFELLIWLCDFYVQFVKQAGLELMFGVEINLEVSEIAFVLDDSTLVLA